MTSWSLRHAGSDRMIDGLSSADVVRGLSDGQWDQFDEVRTSCEQSWRAIDDVPEFESAIADQPLSAKRKDSDETTLDMNPLIDVSLVLLIFFILTTSYEAIRKVLDMPGAGGPRPSAGVRKGSVEQLKPFTIRLSARTENGRVVYLLEDQVVSTNDLPTKLAKLVSGTGKKQLLIDGKGIEWGAVVTAMDAAKSAGIERTILGSSPAP